MKKTNATNWERRPNPLHLLACQRGGHIQQSKKVYSRKGKKKYNWKKEM